MKKNVTYISSATVLAVLEASGLPIVEKAGWLKVCGASGRRLYVPKTKSVGRIDLVGLSDGPGRRALGGESFGSVTHQLDFSAPEADILSALDAALLDLATLEAAAPKVRTQRVKAPKVPVAAPTRAERKEANIARLSLLKRVAQEKGMAVSPDAPLFAALAADEEPDTEVQELGAALDTDLQG